MTCDPRARHRDDQRAGGGRRRPPGDRGDGRPPVPAVDAVPRPRRVRRRRARAARARRRRRGHRPPSTSRSRPSASPTSGRARWSGTGRPASRSPRRSAGRTCARSASASWPRPPTTSPWRRTSRPPSSPGCSTTSTGARDRDLCFGTVDTLAGVVAHRRSAATSPTTPTPPSPACSPPTAVGVEPARPRRARASPPRCCPDIVDSCGVIAPASALPGRAADRRAVRRPAELAHRPGLRRRRAGPRSRSAPAGCSTSARAPTAPVVGTPRRPRHVPDRRLVASAASLDVGRRGDHAVGRHERRVAPRRPRPHRHERRQPRRRGGRRRRRRRDLRPGPARPRHAAVGLRRPGHARRHHPGHDEGAPRARRAGGRRPPRRRPRRGRRGRHRAWRSGRCASTAG